MKRILLAVAAALLLPHLASAEVNQLLNGSIAVEASHAKSFTFHVDQSEMSNPMLVGHLQASGGTGNDIEVLVLSESDYQNWANDHKVTPLYNSGRVTAADLNVSLPATGNYRLVLSNSFSVMTPKTVEGRVSLSWTPAIVANAAATGVVGMGLLVILGLLAIPGVIAGVIVWAIMSRKKKAAPSP